MKQIFLIHAQLLPWAYEKFLVYIHTWKECFQIQSTLQLPKEPHDLSVSLVCLGR